MPFVISVETLEPPLFGLPQYYKITLSCGHYHKRPDALPAVGKQVECPECYFKSRREILLCPLCKKAGVERNSEEEGDRHIHLGENHGQVVQQPKRDSQQPQRIAQGACPDCGSTLWHSGGCTFCESCGFERCG